MGSRHPYTSPEYLKNMCDTVSLYAVAQEGDPSVGMEMAEMLMEKGFESGLYYNNLYRAIAYGLQGHETENSRYWKSVYETELR
ncbi:hypothetical protein EP073_10770 [Geovibrio thiophilus]|uniref:Uncharacterized protein n=1 Tax=Geovibrio thiophilus TaxID=139438 RepID=A0A3R6AZ41_9BACT|nr:hypothetical protein [Geovibrio thiophilus]QAR33865.1 hypothetical protein EP073_10770 [Geovibrio thiophilus]